MPDRTDAEVANSFASFFSDKILDMWKLFTGIDLLEIAESDIPQLRRISPFSEDECTRLINSLKPET